MAEVTDTKPPALLSEEELQAHLYNCFRGLNTPVTNVLISGSELERLVEMARLSLTLQRRVEEADALRLLQEWVARGIGEDRMFEIRFISGIAHPWAVRLEDEHRSWSLTKDCFDELGRAVSFALREAAREGYE